MKTFIVPRGVYLNSKENLFLGQLPLQTVFGCIENESFNGAIEKNPFRFKYSSVNFVFLYREGEQIPSNLLQLNYSQNYDIQGFCRFLLVLGIILMTQEPACLVRRTLGEILCMYLT